MIPTHRTSRKVIKEIIPTGRPALAFDVRVENRWISKVPFPEEMLLFGCFYLRRGRKSTALEVMKDAALHHQQLFLNGVFYYRKGNIEDHRKALDYYNQAVALDPSFAGAYAGMAWLFALLPANLVIGLTKPASTKR